MTVSADMKKGGETPFFSSDAPGRFRQPRDLAGLLGRAVREQLIQVLAVALVRAELLADRLGEHAYRRRDLVLVVVLAQEVDDLPVVRTHLHVFHFRDLVRDVLAPVAEVGEIAFLVRLDGIAAYGECHALLLAVCLRSKPGLAPPALRPHVGGPPANHPPAPP